MEYLLAWRMAVARDLLRRHDLGIAEVAERVGYGSASAFSTAFSRHVGEPPSRYARAGTPVSSKPACSYSTRRTSASDATSTLAITPS